MKADLKTNILPKLKLLVKSEYWQNWQFLRLGMLAVECRIEDDENAELNSLLDEV